MLLVISTMTDTKVGKPILLIVIKILLLVNKNSIDIAISAPYEGSGVVYIYHGQEMDSSGSIIDTSYKQVIIDYYEQ